MNRIEKEKTVIKTMIMIFCRKHHAHRDGGLCSECEDLLKYAHQRLERCPKGETKTSCRKCEIHCYAPAKREAVRAVMRYVGPRMLFIHPVMAVRHLISELR